MGEVLNLGEVREEETGTSKSKKARISSSISKRNQEFSKIDKKSLRNEEIMRKILMRQLEDNYVWLCRELELERTYGTLSPSKLSASSDCERMFICQSNTFPDLVSSLFVAIPNCGQ